MTLAVEGGISPLIQLQLAREIAADMREIPDILAIYEINSEQWETLQGSPRFRRLLQTSMEEWQSVANTAERVKVKSLAFVEEVLPEFYGRVHDPKETLSAKNEVLKTISRLAGIGGTVEGAITGERMVITINLGADQQLSFVKSNVGEEPALDLSPEDYMVTSESKIAAAEEIDEEDLDPEVVAANDELGAGLEGEPL
jgi:hypothetical protein